VSKTEFFEPFTEGEGWAQLIKALLAEDTSFEARMAFLQAWNTKGQAQFLRAIMTLDTLRAQNRQLLEALEAMTPDYEHCAPDMGGDIEPDRVALIKRARAAIASAKEKVS